MYAEHQRQAPGLLRRQPFRHMNEKAVAAAPVHNRIQRKARGRIKVRTAHERRQLSIRAVFPADDAFKKL